MYDFGKIVLVPFPFTDLTAQKLRPALIISKRSTQNSVVLLFITSKTQNDNLSYPLYISKNEHTNSGLKVDSYLRCDKIATLDTQLIFGELGRLEKSTLNEIGQTFFSVFGFACKST